MARELGLTFEVPPDVKEIYIEMGLDLTRFNGDDSWILPLPGRIVIDGEGLIRNVEVDPDYTVRPEPTETLELVRGLAGGA